MTAPCTKVDQEWGELPTPRRGWRLRRNIERDDFALAQHAQVLRCEREALGYATETAAYYADGGVERRLRLVDLRTEKARQAEQARDLPVVHGTAGAYPTCTAGDGGGRCEPCRAYQRWRVAANRQDRAARPLCTGTRSSYDAGCRCQPCTAANTAGCARWREKAAA